MSNAVKFARATLLPGGEHSHVFPRLDIIILLFASLVGLLLVVLDVYQRWIAVDPMETFNIDGHNNPATWFHAAILTGASLSALAIAFTVFDGRRRWSWMALGASIAFFSMDKTISLHEQVGARLQSALSLPDGSGRIAWEVAWSPIILLVVVTLALCVAESNRRTKLWTLGLVLGGAAKLALEALTYPLLRIEHTAWLHGLEAELEESVQLLAFACLFAGFAQLFVDRVSALARGEIALLDEEHRSERLALGSLLATLPAPRRIGAMARWLPRPLEDGGK
ncbi:MAG: hypothetical protein HY873_05645 [Chloroflexi bacterium]|nr:hypothetical protein [Chloroflexota bacterium]